MILSILSGWLQKVKGKLMRRGGHGRRGTPAPRGTTAPRSRIRLCLEQLEDRIIPSASPHIALTFATTTDTRTISVNYTISGASLAGQNVSFDIYRSAAFDSLGGAQLIGTATIPGSDSSDLSLGTHRGVKLSLTAPNGQPVTALTPNTALPFIDVVANLDGSSASFETHVLGVVSHGLEFDPTLIKDNLFYDVSKMIFGHGIKIGPLVPVWETRMAAALQQQDGYQDVIAFNWVLLSVELNPTAVVTAGNMLLQQVKTQADQLASEHPGDVVDINFIGHSRGGPVISEVLQDLVGTTDPALQGGYMQMTLLDPHPANPLYSQFSVSPFVELFLPKTAAAAFVNYIESKMQDPQVIVPSNVEKVQLFDQQTPAGSFGFLEGFLMNPSASSALQKLLQNGVNKDALLNLAFSYSELWEFLTYNLWGDTTKFIKNDSGQPIEQKSLTNVFADKIGLIGHSEVPLWYLANVVKANETFSYFS